MMSIEKIMVGGYYKIGSYVFYVKSAKDKWIVCQTYNLNGCAYNAEGQYLLESVAKWAEKRVKPRQ